jgi:CheY-like chemotaxis protein
MTKRRELIVDDYPDAAETTCMLLTLLGHDCRFATNGTAALACLVEFEPEVAILDIGLPDLSGFELAVELRKRLPGKRLFLAALTGWGQPEDRIKSLAAGFDHHILKPADQTKLKRIMELAGEALTSSDERGPA